MAKKKSEGNVYITHEEKVLSKSMDDVIHDSMIPYAEHVILERALPRVEDGLKPVQRRILYTMMELSVTPDKPHRKSARIVGDCLGKYHPHGDSSVYDAMVRMAQPFNMSATLVDGHGNFGSIDGDSAAAMRYTEARMTELAMEMLRDIDKDTIKFNLNFDDTLKEPEVLPARFPNLLVNGASGIAVAIATNIPPHNITETISAVVAQIDDPDITTDKLMEYIPCPDFPTGGFIIKTSDIKNAYETGRGKLAVRAKTHIETQKNGKSLIVITELPYQVNKARLLEDILKLSQTKKDQLSGISDIRDESDRMGMRAVIEVKKDSDPNVILSYLLKYSDMQTSFGVNMMAIAGGKPKLLGLKEALAYYIEHQRDVTLKRTKYELLNAKKREHILEGLMVALLNIDEVIALIRASKTPKAAKAGLMERFSLSETQAQAILDLRLQRLTNLEALAIEREYNELKKQIKKLQEIIDSPKKLMELIKTELNDVKERFFCERRTKLIDDIPISLPTDKEVSSEKCLIALLRGNKLRRLPEKGSSLEQIMTEHPIAVIKTTTDRRIRLFTSLGTCISLNVTDIPEGKLTARPTLLNSIVSISDGEQVIAAMDDLATDDICLCTAHGNIKCTEASEFNSRQKRIIAITLKDDDRLISAQRVHSDSIIMITAKGMSIRFPIDTVPKQGRSSVGVRGIKLDVGDKVVFASQMDDEGEILLMSEFGYMKRCFAFDYEVQNRYGKGVKTFDFKKNGANGTEIVFVCHVKAPLDINVVQNSGNMTVINSEMIPIEAKSSKATPIITAVLGDVIVDAYAPNGNELIY